jgi:FtsH-binding integral membrane protein
MDYSINSRTQTQVAVNSFVQSVYGWMAFGLGITGIVAMFVANSQTMLQLIFGNKLVFFGLIIAELALVFFISSRIDRMEAGTATGLFLLYAALNGATLSFIFLAFTRASIASTFFICAGTFAACSVYGYVTQKDLTSFGGFLFMGLIGIIIASVVNIFLKSPMIYWIISYVGVGIFMGLTAYDTQKIKQMAYSQPADLEAGVVRKGAIMGALSLYLDFINMFIFMLHIFGGRE